MTTKKINIMLLSIIVLFSGQLQAECNSNITEATPTSSFTTNDDGTATDNQTGLMWMRCSLGQTWNNTDGACDDTTTPYNWQAALSEADGYTFATLTDWRLPNLNELTSIVETACYSPAINDTTFPNTPSSYYWTSSQKVPHSWESSDLAWTVSFNNSREGYSTRDSTLNVRLVRTGQ